MTRLADRPEWRTYLEWFQDLSRLVDEQHRDKLDAELPDELCEHVLSESKLELYESADIIRGYRLDPTDRVISAAASWRTSWRRAAVKAWGEP